MKKILILLSLVAFLGVNTPYLRADAAAAGGAAVGDAQGDEAQKASKKKKKKNGKKFKKSKKAKQAEAAVSK